MGYILPIQHDTYNQYVNRSIPVKYQYSHIFPTDAIQLTKKDIKEKKQYQQCFSDVLDQKMEIKLSAASSLEKGKIINEYV
jgi:hypothetical protein